MYRPLAASHSQRRREGAPVDVEQGLACPTRMFSHAPRGCARPFACAPHGSQRRKRWTLREACGHACPLGALSVSVQTTSRVKPALRPVARAEKLRPGCAVNDAETFAPRLTTCAVATGPGRSLIASPMPAAASAGATAATSTAAATRGRRRRPRRRDRLARPSTSSQLGSRGAASTSCSSAARTSGVAIMLSATSLPGRCGRRAAKPRPCPG